MTFMPYDQLTASGVSDSGSNNTGVAINKGTPEAAGRVYAADPTQESLVKTGGNEDAFWVVGLAVTAGESAGDDVDVVKAGEMTATAHGLTVGLPCYLDSNGAVTSTPPSAAGEAVVRVGMVKDTNTIDVQIQVVGVN